jgi:hypothetical protein
MTDPNPERITPEEAEAIQTIAEYLERLVLQMGNMQILLLVRLRVYAVVSAQIRHLINYKEKIL